MQSPIIYSVLNWGLGHATRSVPVISELLELGRTVHLASSGDAYTYLEKEFPALPIIELPDYEVQYPTRFMPLNVISFAYSMIKAISQEHAIIRDYASQHDITIAFSDNRYGCYLSEGNNYFISHQLNIKTGDRFSSFVGNNIQRRWLNKYDRLLIPDFRQMPNLSGSLSQLHGKKNVSFLGPLTSHHEPESSPINYEWCCILSGVEPQRARLAKKLFKILDKNNINAAIIAGKKKPAITSTDTVTVFPLLNKKKVQQIVSESNYLCLRSGYSSIMDLCVWRKPALLIPTPGQTEQEYLAKHLVQEFKLSRQDQDDISQSDFLQAPHSTDLLPHIRRDILRSALKRLLD